MKLEFVQVMTDYYRIANLIPHEATTLNLRNNPQTKR